MSPAKANHGTWEIRVGDALEELRKMPDESVHCCVTSPPYWGLRDYGVDGQLGLEATPEEYVENMVEVFREVRRVLRDDGTLWLNLGDSYAGSGPSGASYQSETTKRRAAGDGQDGTFRVSKTLAERGLTYAEKKPVPPPGLKPKDLCGIPWRIAFALQADGWWLRSDIIWSKPNPMPESVQDRPTKAHEYLFLLSKSERYYYDADAVAEPLATDPSENYPARAKVTGRGTQGAADARGNDRDKSGGFPPTNNGDGPTRNRRTVWEITTKPFPEAHFAVYPPELIEPCIKAGTSEKGCCPECGAPWERVVERPEEPEGLRNRGNGAKMDFHDRQTGSDQKLQDWMDANPKETTGWQPTCDHDGDPVPCTVLDPFSGAGTTGLVTLRLRRSYIGIELNPEYAEMSCRRIENDDPLWNRPSRISSR